MDIEVDKELFAWNMIHREIRKWWLGKNDNQQLYNCKPMEVASTFVVINN